YFLLVFFFFFFQAEDGIRDKLVTGVQTCALPISCALSSHPTFGVISPAGHISLSRGRNDPVMVMGKTLSTSSSMMMPGSSTGARSEERRVGKECRARGGTWHEKKKRGNLLRGTRS